MAPDSPDRSGVNRAFPHNLTCGCAGCEYLQSEERAVLDGLDFPTPCDGAFGGYACPAPAVWLLHRVKCCDAPRWFAFCRVHASRMADQHVFPGRCTRCGRVFTPMSEIVCHVEPLRKDVP